MRIIISPASLACGLSPLGIPKKSPKGDAQEASWEDAEPPLLNLFSPFILDYADQNHLVLLDAYPRSILWLQFRFFHLRFFFSNHGAVMFSNCTSQRSLRIHHHILSRCSGLWERRVRLCVREEEIKRIPRNWGAARWGPLDVFRANDAVCSFM